MWFSQMVRSPKTLTVIIACIIFGAAYMAFADARENFNVPTSTFGGMQLWEDLRVHSEWRIQRNVVTGHYRLLDDGDIRRAWGSWDECNRALDEARATYDLEPGSDHAVVLLHGLGRTKSMYRSLARDLEAAGY